MTVNVRHLPPRSTFTPAQALAAAAQTKLSDVIVVGFDADGDLFVRSSRMSRSDALWIAKELERWALNGGLE